MTNGIIEKRIKRFKAFGDTLPFARVYHRLDWDVNYFDLFGKQFGMMSVEPADDAIITLKGLPEKNEELRELYSDITPGYYANKVHWNSIRLSTNQLSDEEIEEMIRISYELVAKKLPAKDRKQLNS